MIINNEKYEKLPVSMNKLDNNINYNKLIIFAFIIIIFICNFLYNQKSEQLINENNKYNMLNLEDKVSNLINENFFVFDSNNLNEIKSHLYGYIVSKDGILTDQFYKKLGEYKDPYPQGAYIMIRKKRNEIIINQDYYGSIGLYIYKNKDEKYFALSNSFLLLNEYLLGKKNLSFNKEFADNFIVSPLITFSIEETLIKEINQIPSNAFILINTKMKELKIYYKNYEENSVPLESKEGLSIIDNWFDKWGYIFRSLKQKTDNIITDLSGGFDTRTMITIILNSVNNTDELHIHSFKDYRHDHDIDFKIAQNISKKYGFKLNNYSLDYNQTNWSINDTLLATIYSKLGFHKEFYLKTFFYHKPRFSFAGSGGEMLRGFPNMPIEKYKMTCSKDIKFHEKEFYESSEKIFNRSISFLKTQKTFNNDYEISFDIHSKCMGRNHFGKLAFENFMTNNYIIQPLMDPEIKKIKFDFNKSKTHDLIAYIMVRFAHDLIYFPFQGNRTLDTESIKKAERLNLYMKQYKRKYDFNNNFFIDNNRKSPVNSIKNNETAYDYLNKIIKSPDYINTINKIYDKYVYDWANKYILSTNYFPLTHHYALLAVVKIYENLLLNEKIMKK